MGYDAFVIYEDQATEVKEFGPHKLLCAAVADRLELPWFEVRKRVHAIPAKGSGKLLGMCAQVRLAKLAPSGQTVVALIDSDRIHELLGLDKSTCRPNVLEDFRERTGAAENLNIVLLERNVEDLIETVSEILPDHTEPFTKAARREKLRPNERDIVLNRCATGLPEWRRRLLEEMPSFKRLVNVITAELRDSI